jgi:2,3,4,5-tetrahydropyridine-2-carboxylate N-succinyltransferase
MVRTGASRAACMYAWQPDLRAGIVDMRDIENVVDAAWEQRAALDANVAGDLRPALEAVMDALEAGTLRVAEPGANGGWQVNQWVKRAILLYFRVHDARVMDGGPMVAWDKVPLRFAGAEAASFRAAGARIVPGALVRRGAFIGKDAVLMPGYVNVGAHVGAGTMVDTWATVGSCAQIGARVHLSGGVGIGGVLEPPQAAPTIIEDDCFIGARSEVVEGVVVEQGCVLGMGVYLGQSTRIYDRAAKTVTHGRVPAGSVVVSGSLPAADGSHSLYAAVIVKHVDAKTRAKTSINELLRSGE